MTNDLEKLQDSFAEGTPKKKTVYDLERNEEFIELREQVELQRLRFAAAPETIEWHGKMDAARLAWHENAAIHTEMCREQFIRSNELYERQVKEQARTADAFERIASVLEHIAEVAKKP